MLLILNLLVNDPIVNCTERELIDVIDTGKLKKFTNPNKFVHSRYSMLPNNAYPKR